MFTRCPNCHTLFRISLDQLKAANGLARCCECEEIFNALQNLQSLPGLHAEEQRPPDTSGQPLADEKTTLEAKTSEADELFDADAEGNEQTSSYMLLDSDSVILDSIDFSLPEKGAAGVPLDDIEAKQEDELSVDRVNLNDYDLDIDSNPSQEIESKTTALLAEAEEDVALVPAEDQPQPSDAEPPSTPPGEQSQPSSADKEKPPAHTLDEDSFDLGGIFIEPGYAKQSRLWGFGALLLLIVLGGQLTWQFRDQIAAHPLGRDLLQQACNQFNCTLPQRRDPKRIVVVERDLRIHPEHDDALYLQLDMVNQASFEQPFPKLQLSLFNEAGKAVARRTFLPAEYLPLSLSTDNLMPAGLPIRIQMELVDPGSDVIGFKFEFL
ncbi:hypothetical protein QQ73_15415 [Candidatus Endoriftia persephone str. Guaymas]|jgi:predicted Zn finger-like uncharacterized protein|uniref:Zinc-ribbon domain-containing protein n=3 Tax=Gammaproteobacteria TaxID=1236 RepID=A0A9J6ZXB3_9GAMM|nr:zinc-ribbon and DUF3426 domain-containing protein [Candidatus Endoriftia persephone]EGW54260.1 hypothetical protein TevJSym_ao00460 [endosymbiont of Tevnia jerichonana (vent Tica)]MBA1332424.1 hypothetical protein [Candidatus Endoriftia persephone str. Guaymas]USF87441.1 zinc-ribbon domain-containing protein [Candidatus Endoriftia persephone]